jgi:leucine dehydrogenase
MEVESLHRLESHGVEMIIAIDSTRAGPALGGCRWRPYPDSASARREAIALARAMTRKAALARLWLGGGKAVVVGDPKRRTRDDLLRFGEFVQSLGGRYITAADMGTGTDEMTVIAETTSNVVGLPRERGGCGDPSPYTARGVCLAIEAALGRSGRALEGAIVAVQGIGHVGRALIDDLVGAGAHVIASDPEPAALSSLPEGVRVVPPDQIATEACEVFAPCGPSGVIDADVADALDCRIVCGAANNPLSELSIGRRLAARDILYIPDFLANAGGLIHLAVALEGGDEAASYARLRVIAENLERVLAYAESCGGDPAVAAERIATALSTSLRIFGETRSSSKETEGSRARSSPNALQARSGRSNAT